MRINGLCLAIACALGLAAAAIPAAARADGLASLVGPVVGLDYRGLPNVLDKRDVELYRQIFALQDEGHFAAADGLIATLGDRRLMGHVLAQRYLHPTAYRTSYAELAVWLERYGDHPEAERLHALAMRRLPKGAEPPRRPLLAPVSVGGGALSESSFYRSERARSPQEGRAVRRFEHRVHQLVRDDKLEEAEAILEREGAESPLDAAEIDQLQGDIARAHYDRREFAPAFALAASAAARSGELVPTIHWVAGLAAWRRGAWDEAAHHFGQAATSPRSSAWLAAGGAYWASRAHLRRRDPGSMSKWLALAATYPRTFYGLIAREALGIPTEFDFEGLELSRSEVQNLVASPSGGRALALLQAGRSRLAREELLLIGDWRHGNLGEVMVALADRARMPRFSLTLASQLSDLRGLASSGRPLLAALYPVPHWEPDGGFAVDRALLYAVMRQESAFDPLAVSHAGARGLMQLMPRTASYIADDPLLRGRNREALHDPGLNLRLGQDYLVHLMTLSDVGDSLFYLLAAYNAGPGNLGRWQEGLDAEQDALLFIESIPYGETRAYIEKVLANFWIYRKRLDQPTPSLTELANGDWPHYRQMEAGVRHAWIPEP